MSVQQEITAHPEWVSAVTNALRLHREEKLPVSKRSISKKAKIPLIQVSLVLMTDYTSHEIFEELQRKLH